MKIPKKRIIKLTALRNKIGNYLVTWNRDLGCNLSWTITPHPWDARNFEGSPNELFTAQKHFKPPEWTVVRGTISWKEK